MSKRILLGYLINLLRFGYQGLSSASSVAILIKLPTMGAGVFFKNLNKDTMLEFGD